MKFSQREAIIFPSCERGDLPDILRIQLVSSKFVGEQESIFRGVGFIIEKVPWDRIA